MKLIMLNLALAGLWLLLLRYCYRNSFQDPSSYFFDRTRAYEQSYSALRETQSDDFLGKASTVPATAQQPLIYNKGSSTSQHEDTNNSRICIGIPSVEREREQFVGKTMASLIDTLSPEERRTITLKVLLADEEPQSHSAYGQSWLENIADDILLYGHGSSESGEDKYKRLSWDGHHRPRGEARNHRVQLDYANLMEACRNQETDYFILVEDDVIASEDWLKRLQHSLFETEAQNTGRDWLYLRLFYSETYLGWNSEQWPEYLCNITFVYVAISAIVFFIRANWTSKTKPMELSIKSSLMTVFYINVWMTAFVALYFMAGRLMVSPLQPGVCEMPQYGCCAQGLAIPQRHLEMLETKLREPPYELAGDSFIEAVADQEGLKKWAMVPSVLQHIGIRGSSADGGYRKTTWNFSFEKRPRAG